MLHDHAEVSTCCAYLATGVVRLEDGAAWIDAHKKRSIAHEFKRLFTRTHSDWMYAVLDGHNLILYANYASFRHGLAPLYQLPLVFSAPSANENVFGFRHDYVYVRTSAARTSTPHDNRKIVLRVRKKMEVMQWVRALYSLAYPTLHQPEQEEEPQSELEDCVWKTKRVSFQDEPHIVHVPRLCGNNAAKRHELYYSPRDFRQFKNERERCHSFFRRLWRSNHHHRRRQKR